MSLSSSCSPDSCVVSPAIHQNFDIDWILWNWTSPILISWSCH
ncbi:hypothetical protein GBAR_LOCUS12587 [Geodia barretti]|uniref:Uncharacterized protein n=1 Tax=Geodia barretti TaxID=519541 RepID=A0AA35S0R3_GEOBA|nr:hypothetical protein GBAR_LOCUS12587 [Geodia barretti]